MSNCRRLATFAACRTESQEVTTYPAMSRNMARNSRLSRLSSTHNIRFTTAPFLRADLGSMCKLLGTRDSFPWRENSVVQTDDGLNRSADEAPDGIPVPAPRSLRCHAAWPYNPAASTA